MGPGATPPAGACNFEAQVAPQFEDSPSSEAFDLDQSVFDKIAAGPIYDPHDNSAEQPDPPCLSEVLSIMYAWMGYHKATYVAAEDAWNMLALLIPPTHNLPAFSYAKGILEKHLNNTCEIIEMCPCDRMAYFDCQSGPLQRFKNAHRTRCHMPGCGLSRLVTIKTQHGMREVPRKVMYYNPLKFFMQDLFKDKDLVGHLHHDAGEHAPGKLPVATRHTLLMSQRHVTRQLTNKT